MIESYRAVLTEDDVSDEFGFDELVEACEAFHFEAIIHSRFSENYFLDFPRSKGNGCVFA
jgi:hypothetical protein